MLTFRASGAAQASVRVWYGNNGQGLLDLFERKNGAYALVATNPSPDAPLAATISPEPNLVRMSVRTLAADITGAALPVFLELSQHGVVLPADDGSGPPYVNGQDPYQEVRLQPDAKHNAPVLYYFNVSFS